MKWTIIHGPGCTIKQLACDECKKKDMTEFIDNHTREQLRGSILKKEAFLKQTCLTHLRPWHRFLFKISPRLVNRHIDIHSEMSQYGFNIEHNIGIRVYKEIYWMNNL